MERLICIGLFLLGMIFWSFWSVLLSRLQASISWQTIKSILIGRSYCPSCHHNLEAPDLMPLFSYLISRGKCRYCGSAISSFYPLLELISGVVFVLTYLALLSIDPFSRTLYAFLVAFHWLLLLLVFGDLRYFELHLPIWFAMLALWIIPVFLGYMGSFHDVFWAAIWMYAAFFFIYKFSKIYVRIRFGLKDTEWFGLGDVMVALSIGLFLPLVFMIQEVSFDYLPFIVLLYICISSICGVVFAGISWLFFGSRQGKSIPFLPAMALWYLILLFFMKDILLLILS